MEQATDSILTLTTSCISKFKTLLTFQDQGRAARFESRLADFSVWADGVGALAKSKASLDTRLKGRKDDIALVKNVLLMLADSLDYLANLPKTDSSFEGGIENLDSSIKNLALIGVAIRRTGKASRNRRADKTFNADEYQEFRKYLECVAVVRPTEGAVGDHIAELNVSKTSDLQRRLIEANLRRRHSFVLAQKRSRVQTTTPKQNPEPAMPSKIEASLHNAPPVKTGMHATEYVDPVQILHVSEEGSRPTISRLTYASTAEEPLNYSTVAKKYTPEAVKSLITVIASAAEFPQPPSADSGRKISKCPCCCQSLPIETFTNPKIWKQHIVEDICPYTCLAENCPTPQVLFVTRHDWERHVRESHLPQWECPFCEEQDTMHLTIESMGIHLQTQHEDELSISPLPKVLSWAAVHRIGIKSCPLCAATGPEDSPELIDHVLRHSYEFALRALPWPPPATHDLNKPPGGFKLPEDPEQARDLRIWIDEAFHQDVANPELSLCRYDRADHSGPASTNLSEFTEYFVSNNYFGDMPDDRSSQPEISDQEPSKAMDEVAEVVKEIERLSAASAARKQQGPPRAQIVHRVKCHKWRSDRNYFLDQPSVVQSDPFAAHLRGSQPINNFELYLERNEEIAFVVYKDYECCDKQLQSPPREQGESDLDIDASFLLQGEEISLIAPELKKALDRIAHVALEAMPHPDFEGMSNDKEDDKITYPYLWYFHRRTRINEEIDNLPPATRLYADCFRDYIESRMEEEWQSVKNLMHEGKISAQYIEYLVAPGQIIISQGNTSTLSQRIASVVEDWLHVRRSPDSFSASVSTYTWAFDGNFSKAYTDIDIHDIPSLEEPFNILDLRLYPVEFAREDEVEALRKRGRMFWKCRTRNYVSLRTESEDDRHNSMSARFMVDIATYKELHGNKWNYVRATPGEDNLAAEYMSQDDPDLGDDFFMCLPTSIPGFNMQKKEWVNLDVHYIRDVEWNTEAFEFLVIERETKLLIQAVVTNRVRASENTDLITGKGNGLFILLHGGPGTGKTLTAESVAEIARRPLYRVTCGDIGTKAEDVESYLDFVLLLGKKWGCVVLLDEADVFLEQRSVSNLERNALVTVFLRVLEYYDGILILTSNRVGILDEAFKSRIQLNLRYKTLERDQRLQIWKNFLERLQRLEQEKLKNVSRGDPGPNLGYGIKFKEISNEIEVLAKAELNGRQIRNAISTARELATYQREPMGYEHLKIVIKEAEKFDEYLLELNEYFTADQIQRDKKER